MFTTVIPFKNYYIIIIKIVEPANFETTIHESKWKDQENCVFRIFTNNNFMKQKKNLINDQIFVEIGVISNISTIPSLLTSQRWQDVLVMMLFPMMSTSAWLIPPSWLISRAIVS